MNHPFQGLVVLQIKCLHVLEANLLAHDLLVDRSAEMAVQNATFVERFTDDAADEFEEHQMLRVDRTEAVGVECRAIGSNRYEESVVGVEHLA